VILQRRPALQQGLTPFRVVCPILHAPRQGLDVFIERALVIIHQPLPFGTCSHTSEPREGDDYEYYWFQDVFTEADTGNTDDPTRTLPVDVSRQITAVMAFMIESYRK